MNDYEHNKLHAERWMSGVCRDTLFVLAGVNLGNAAAVSFTLWTRGLDIQLLTGLFALLFGAWCAASECRRNHRNHNRLTDELRRDGCTCTSWSMWRWLQRPSDRQD